MRAVALTLTAALLAGCAIIPGHRYAPTPGLPIPALSADFKRDIEACGGSTESAGSVLVPGSGYVGYAMVALELVAIPVEVWRRTRERRCMEARGWQVVGSTWFLEPGADAPPDEGGPRPAN